MGVGRQLSAAEEVERRSGLRVTPESQIEVAAGFLRTVRVETRTVVRNGERETVGNVLTCVRIALATGAGLAWALPMILGMVVCLSSLLGSQARAAGLESGVFVLFSIGSIWTAAVRCGPTGLLGASTDTLLGRAGPLLWPVIPGMPWSRSPSPVP